MSKNYNYSNGEKKIVGIYKITNIVSNKVYIGSSNFVQSRLRLHKNHLKKNMHCNQHMQNSFNKYGENAFIYEMIEECDQENIISREQYWIDTLEATDPTKGYNKRLLAHTNAGIKRSKETRKRISEAKKGKRYLPDSHYEKLAEANRGKPNQGAIDYQNSLSSEQKTKNAYRALEGREKAVKERGSYFTKEGMESYKRKRGKKIYQYDKDLNLVNEFVAVADALRFLGMNPKSTSCITNQLDKEKLYKGYYWKSNELTVGNGSQELGELLETPEEGNQQPSLGSNTLEGSQTNSRVLPNNNGG